MSATAWFFTYVASDGSEADWPASADAPFYREHNGEIWTFERRRFIAEGLTDASFWAAMRSTPCPQAPKRPATKPDTPGYGRWTPESATEFAASLDFGQLQDHLHADADFARAIEASKKPRQELQGDSASVAEAKYFIRLNEADKPAKLIRDRFRWS